VLFYSFLGIKIARSRVLIWGPVLSWPENAPSSDGAKTDARLVTWVGRPKCALLFLPGAHRRQRFKGSILILRLLASLSEA
jgi:hypothetical protein